MIQCSINALTKSYGAEKIFETITFSIQENDRIGLIGQNGCGKTTLMKILIGEETATGGEVYIKKGLRLGYLAQTHAPRPLKTAREVLTEAFSEALSVQAKMKALETEFSLLTGDALDEAMRRYGQAMEAFEQLDGYNIEMKIERICNGLGLDTALQETPFETLSGGEKTRIALAKLLLEAPDLLLLDEPTNHLDMKAIRWLEQFIAEYGGAVMAISHDRYFLDKVATQIYELTPSEMHLYKGNYSDYVIEKERRFVEAFRQYQNQQRQIGRMKEQIHRYRVWGAMRDSEVMYKRAKELEKRLEKIDALDKPIRENRRMRLSEVAAERSGKRVLTLESVDKSFGLRQLFKQATFTLFYKDSVCLMGPNGSGKTTLIKMILGDSTPDAGKILIGAGVKPGYLPQEITFPNPAQTLVEYFADTHGVNFGTARGALAQALFTGEDVMRRISSLSGGEKTRLKLCSMTYEKVNLLILDEPTNHLDIESREVLEEMLIDFDGTLLFVSHDRYFVEQIADQIVEIKDGALIHYPFGYSEYLEASEHTQPSSEPAQSPSVNQKPNLTSESLSTPDVSSSFGSDSSPSRPAKATNEKFNEKRFEIITAEIESLEAKLKALEAAMSENATNAERLSELDAECKAVSEQIQPLYEKWEQLMR